MPRYEIAGCATEVFKLSDIQTALRKSGARNVRSRCAYGWPNQPHVATFSAADDKDASRIADLARDKMNRPGSLPAFIAHPY